MDRISPNITYAFIMAKYRLGLLPVIFHNRVTMLWSLFGIFKARKALQRGYSQIL